MFLYAMSFLKRGGKKRIVYVVLSQNFYGGNCARAGHLGKELYRLVEALTLSFVKNPHTFLDMIFNQ